jgi:hypothetical protein
MLQIAARAAARQAGRLGAFGRGHADLGIGEGAEGAQDQLGRLRADPLGGWGGCAPAVGSEDPVDVVLVGLGQVVQLGLVAGVVLSRDRSDSISNGFTRYWKTPPCSALRSVSRSRAALITMTSTG